MKELGVVLNFKTKTIAIDLKSDSNSDENDVLVKHPKIKTIRRIKDTENNHISDITRDW